MNICLLIPAIVGLVCALLGYLLGKATSKGGSDDKEIEALKSKNSALEAELNECKGKLSGGSKPEKAKASNENKSTNIASSLTGSTSLETKPKDVISAFDAEAAKAVFGKKIKQDDLTIVEGIGPKISELFNNNGVNTWKELSEASIEKCKEILKSGGDRYKLHNPSSWPKQALLAHEGKWQALVDLQNTLNGGK